MKDRGVACRCIRCREAGERVEFRIKKLEFRIIKYQASGGEEYFLSYESKDGKILYGFCRLRLMSHNSKLVTHNSIKNAALIRELHVYGELVSVGSKKIVQHAGLGKMLMKEAEKIAKEKGYEKIAVISGVGVRGYYRKLGYKLKDSYMIKSLV
jgi:elongator complex protein 3